MADQVTKSELASAVVFVNDEPYCIWGWDLEQRNRQFLDGFDTGHFPFMIETFLSASDEKRASIALKTTLHHSLETLFSLLGAFLQAPNCVYAWLDRCSTKELRKIVERVSASDSSLHTRWKVPNGWLPLAQMIFRQYMPGTEKAARTIDLFATLWERLAHEFLEQAHIDEYNSIKHGLRVRAGGFTLQVGSEHVYGVPPPQSEMQTIGHSEFGTTFLRLERLGPQGSRNFRSRQTSINWPIERVALQAQLAAMSIENVVGALLIANGKAASTVLFHRPPEDSDFERPWSFSTGTTKVSFDFVIEETWIPPVNREQLLQLVSEAKNERK